MKKIFKHFWLITRHKLYVGYYCFKCGLYKQGLLHDLSKYSWVEFSNSVKYYTGTRSPIDNEKDAKGYSHAWLHHVHHNPHHWVHWIDFDNSHPQKAVAVPIPNKFIAEMICDWLAAGRVYDGAITIDSFWEKKKDDYLLHPETKETLDKWIEMIGWLGVNDGLRNIKEFLKTD